mgnify:CR=1 FL=1
MIINFKYEKKGKDTLQKKADSVIEDVKKLRNEMFELVFNGVSREEMDVVRNVAEKINFNMTEMLTHGKV